jgi:long-chain acyl-CoA synthetase
MDKTDSPILDDFTEAVAELTRDGPFAMQEIVAHGRKIRVFAGTKRNLPAFFQDAEADFADRDLVAEEAGRRWTYGEIFARSRRLASALQDRYGVKPGDRVGIAMRNRPDWIVAFLAATRIGAIAVLFNSRGAADELAAAAADVTCSVHVADRPRAEMLRDADTETPIILVADEPGESPALAHAAEFEAVLATAARDAEIVDSEPDAPAAILFTSGTTGRPKGAVLTHRNLTTLVAGIQFNQAAGGLVARKRGAAPARPPAPYSALLVFPLFHISGIMAVVTVMMLGGMMTMIRRWSPELVLDLVESNNITSVTGPPLVLSDLLDQPRAAERLAGVTRFLAGGQATALDLVGRVSKMLPQAAQGVGWGATETTSSVCGCAGAVFAAKPDSCGPPLPIVDLRVVDDDGRDLPQGGIGELWVSGASVMPGYWNAPEATAATFDGGWYKTGDVGFVDEDGFVHVVDRKKDMVISAGENIYCAEVERVLSSDPAFKESALFGVPDRRLGERAIAAVTLREGSRRTEDEVKALVRAALADYKIPSEVTFDLGPLPRSVTGKVDKRALRARYLQRIAQSA